MGKAMKKYLKARAKALKKSRREMKSRVVRFSEGVKGIIYLILAVSLAVALVLSDAGKIITLEDIVGNLFAAFIGKVILVIIAIAFLIYGLKHLGLVR
jgi:hypothetical protein